MKVHNWMRYAVVFMIALGLAACSPTGEPSPREEEPTHEPEQPAGGTEEPRPSPAHTAEPSETPPDETTETTAGRSVRLTPTLPRGVERVPVVESTPVTGEVPEDFLNAVFDDLVAEEQIDRDAIEVIRAESVVWNDGSLGCPEPGVMYTQALVNGYWIILKVGEDTYDYRSSEGGYFSICDNPSMGVRDQSPEQ